MRRWLFCGLTFPLPSLFLDRACIEQNILHILTCPELNITTQASMSVMTTSRVILPQAITLSINGRDQEPTDEPAPAPNSRSDIRCVDGSSNPATWPSQYRDVPSRKPINRNLDMMTRPGGANIAEQIFIATLLNGVRLNVVSPFIEKS